MTHFFLIAMLLFADDSTLVKAAKANGGLKPMPKKTITNKDVKSSKGKIKEVPNAGRASARPADDGRAEARPTSVQEFEGRKKSEAAAQKRVADATDSVAELEKELTRVEQSYYEASDLNYRDTTLTARFAQTKKQLDAAHAQLTDAREALAALTPPPKSP